MPDQRHQSGAATSPPASAPAATYDNGRALGARSAAQAAGEAAAARPRPFVERYDPKAIESKWQARWEADRLYQATIDPTRPKYYALTMLPYPSGDLHIGHWYAMTPSDARARWLRMRGYNVMFPIGFDAFGLPAENAAIQRGIHPAEWTYANIDNMRRQLRSMGATWDWEREAVSSDPEYYRWTQWFFVQLFKHGLAYKKMAAVDWCPKDNTTLAREQVIGEDRVCERCKTPVIKKNLEQWFFRITDYADELLDFGGMDWPEPIKLAQTNWIGRSEGASAVFRAQHPDADPIEVFTTRPDTLWGATFMVLAPEHPLVAKLTTPEHREEVTQYVAAATRQTDIQREATDKEKTGVFTGAYAVNPVNNAPVPIWVADYVLLTYGTGAIMGVPAHDQRDFEFARTYGLEIRVVVQPPGAAEGAELTQAWPHDGIMINSGPINGLPAGKEEGQSVKAAIRWLEAHGAGKGAVTYRLRDWLISRQRYWGAPIPIVYCPEHGQVPVPEDQLPVTLPMDVEWRPTGQSPLKLHPTWSQTKCPICGRPATRDTDTMDTFMCSSWYHLRYLSPDYAQGPFDPQQYAYWMPVDTYTGGAEHATMHLIYTRFFHKAARDMGVTEGPEPMIQLRNQGQILGPDGQRMSKSRGNVIDPDEQVQTYGADTVRAYLMFGYQWSEGGPWSTENIQGVVRWLHRVWSVALPPGATEDEGPAAEEPSSVVRHPSSVDAERALRRITHQTIKKVSDDFERFEFNTIVSALMELTNALYKHRETTEGTSAWDEAVTTLLKLMAPVTPHVAEELWTRRGLPYSLHQQAWPSYDPTMAAEDLITLVVQVNGKVRDRVQVPAQVGEAEAKAAALASDGARRFMEGKAPRQVVYVPGRLVNIVV